jgi:hypothetical protein
MTLSDGGTTLVAGAGRGDGGILAPSRGTIVEKPDDASLANSFFDVFFEVQLPDLTRLYNQTPLRVESEIECVPPVASYVHPLGIVPLYTSPTPGQGVHMANLVTAQHRVGGSPGRGVCMISGPDSSCIGMRNVYRVVSNTAGTTFLWSVSGDGLIHGADNLDSVVVEGRTPKNYTVSVTVTGPSLTATCSKVIPVHACVTGTLVALFQAEPVEKGIEVRWRLNEPARITELRLERGEKASGPWTALSAERRVESDVVLALDSEVEVGHTYLYRLVATTTDGPPLVIGPLTVTAGMPITEFALGSPMPNPTAGSTRIDFAVPREAEVQLVVVDVQGRTVATLAAGRYRAGRYQAVWNGQLDGGRAPAGLYFIRFRTPSMTLVRRIAVVR